MRRSSGPKIAATAALAGLAALSAALSPTGAHASGLPPTPEADAGPGITITGVGFSRAQAGAADDSDPVAVARAVKNARSRAAAIAAATGIGVGEVEEVELRQLAQFVARRPAGIAAAAATVRFAIVGGAAESEASRMVGAYGTAFAPVRPGYPSGCRSIKRAVVAARRAATPPAAAAARRNARAAARSAGLRLGPIVSISEAPAPYYGYGSTYYDAVLGDFGPGRFCGFYRRPVFRPDPTTGTLRIVRRVRQRRCVHPVNYSVQLEIGYLAAAG